MPIFFVSDSPPIVGNFPSNVNDPEAVEKYLLDKQQLGGKKIEIRVDGKKTSIINDPTYFVGVKTPLADGGNSLYYSCRILKSVNKRHPHSYDRCAFHGCRRCSSPLSV